MFPHFDQSEYAVALQNAYRRFPAKDSTLDIDFINNRQRVAGLYGAALDGITFTRSTTATYFGSDGLLKTAAINEPRYEYDPVSRRPLGLLIEESRVNYIQYSNDFRDTASAGSARPWVNDGTVVTPASAVAPDGTLTAQLINSSAEVGVRQSNNITNQTITASIFVKAGTAAELRFRDYINETFVTFSSATGIISSQSGVIAASCQSVGAGWFRIIATYTTTTAAWVLNIRPLSAGTFYAWGAQVEPGMFPTSYIPTTAASATRGADVASMTGANFSSWYDQAQGTFLAIFRERVGINTVGATYRHVFLASGTADATSRINSFIDNTDKIASQIYTGGAAQAVFTGQANTGQTTACIAYNTNDSAFTDNGSPPSTDTSVTTPTLTQIQFGKSFDSNANGYLNGHIQRLTYYPKRLPNNLLQYLSRLTA